MRTIPKRGWFAYSLRTLFVVVTVAACSMAYEWNLVQERQLRLIHEREDFASWLDSIGGSVIPADQEHESIQIPADRQRLGDKAIRAVKLPYGFPLRHRAELLFPEAVEISFLPGDAAIAQLFRGARTLETIKHPDRVEAWRLDPRIERNSTDNVTLEDHPAIGDSVNVPMPIGERIAVGLLDPANYLWHSDGACLPLYRVRVTFFRGEDRVDVLFCFGCQVLRIFLNNHAIGGRPFRAGHDLFATAVKELFPDDQTIQAIPLEVKANP